MTRFPGVVDLRVSIFIVSLFLDKTIASSLPLSFRVRLFDSFCLEVWFNSISVVDSVTSDITALSGNTVHAIVHSTYSTYLKFVYYSETRYVVCTDDLKHVPPGGCMHRVSASIPGDDDNATGFDDEKTCESTRAIHHCLMLSGSGIIPEVNDICQHRLGIAATVSRVKYFDLTGPK